MRVIGAVIKRGVRILLVRNKSGGLWVFPGGKIKEGETEKEAIGREIEEELGLDVRIVGFGRRVEIEGVGNTPGQTRQLTCFEIEIEGEIKPQNEILEARWFLTSELALLIAGGEVTEATVKGYKALD